MAVVLPHSLSSRALSIGTMGTKLTRDRVSAVYKLCQSGRCPTMKFANEAGSGKRSIPGRPVLFVHGDTHYYRVDHPLTDSASGKTIDNFMRLETFGSPHTNWVKVSVGASDTRLFSIRPGSPMQR